ncbi:DNA repair protein RecN [hydrothermal vent metagenome]|uniref:DNA repair protein RecN n=1 Tax=hydrothermal vent metagenome TaxID=652676 RepID=A0A3B0ZQ00_9ZZZZ
MLTHIHVKNFAIIENLELEFKSGFTVFSGETGAGKSIAIDAIGLALGDRADSHTVGIHGLRAEIILHFDIEEHEMAKQWLLDHDLNYDNDCTLRRIITKEGRSRAYINGSTVPVQALRNIGRYLIQIHGQHEHQSLTQTDTQRTLLDIRAHCREINNDVAHAYNLFKKFKDELQQLQAKHETRNERIELLIYQVEELALVDAQTDEVEKLEQNMQRASNLELLATAINNTLELINGETRETSSAVTQLATQLSELQHLQSIDPSLKPACDLLDSACIQLAETASELRHYSDSLEHDPEQKLLTEQRLDTLYNLARKHGLPAYQLHTLLESLTQELTALKTIESKTANAEIELKNLEKSYFTKANKLTTTRKKGAKQLARQIVEVIQQLGMPHAKFEIILLPRKPGVLHPQGLEEIEFRVSANPGQSPAALAKVASGGELARISLAIQVVAAREGNTPTFIFDEVDAGVGGAVAESIGLYLHQLGSTHQVFCVTHLPQVASQGHSHLLIEKVWYENDTQTHITELNMDKRNEEIARMLGGKKITQQTRAHAKEMLEHK